MAKAKETAIELQEVNTAKTEPVEVNVPRTVLAQSLALQYYGKGFYEHKDALTDYFRTLTR